MLRHTLPHTLRVRSRKCYHRRYTHTLYACAIRKRTHTLRMAYRSCYCMTLHTLPHVAYADMQPHTLRMRHSKEAEGDAPKQKRKKTTEKIDDREQGGKERNKKKNDRVPIRVCTYIRVHICTSERGAYVCMCQHATICVFILLCVSSYRGAYVCVSILLCVFILLCVLILLCVSSYYYVCLSSYY